MTISCLLKKQTKNPKTKKPAINDRKIYIYKARECKMVHTF